MSDLRAFFDDNPRLAVGFSGGVDSTYLLCEALRQGTDVSPYYVDTVFCRRSDLDFATSVCESLGTRLNVIRLDILGIPGVRMNGPDRCYECKRQIFGHVISKAQSDGYCLVVDGTNASDPESDRPGMRALRELGVRSPLRECGITKDEIRNRSRDLGLPTWDMPSNSCLATRVICGTEITSDILGKVESSESVISDMGFFDFRVRTDGGSAQLEFHHDQIDLARERFDEISGSMEPYYSSVILSRRTR